MGDKAAANTMVLSSEMMASRNLRTMVSLGLPLGAGMHARRLYTLREAVAAHTGVHQQSQLRVALEAVSKEMGQPERAEEARAAGQQTAAQLAERVSVLWASRLASAPPASFRNAWHTLRTGCAPQIRVARTSDAPGHAYILQWGRAPA